MEDTILRRTWAEIDLDALEHNYNVARQKIGPGVKYLGVVKADAYGHGAVQVARKLEQLGADYLAVSSLDEGRELRHGGITMPILILGHTPPEMVSQLIEYNITQAVSAKAKAEAYSAEAVKCGGTLRVHIKVDTGMSRLGFLVRGEHFETGVEAIAESCALPGLDPEGILPISPSLIWTARTMKRIRGSSSASLPMCWTHWPPRAAPSASAIAPTAAP